MAGRATTRTNKLRLHLSTPFFGLWHPILTGPEAPVADRAAIRTIRGQSRVWCMSRPNKLVGCVAQYGLGDIKVRVGLKNEQ